MSKERWTPFTVIVLLSACASSHNHSECGKATVFEYAGAQYCVASQAITEEGFECPAAYANGHEVETFLVCSAEVDLANEVKEAIRREFSLEQDAGVPKEDGGAVIVVADGATSDGSGFPIGESCEESDWVTQSSSMNGAYLIVDATSVSVTVDCGRGRPYQLSVMLGTDLGEVSLFGTISDSDNNDLEIDAGEYDVEGQDHEGRMITGTMRVTRLVAGSAGGMELDFSFSNDIIGAHQSSVKGTSCDWGILLC